MIVVRRQRECDDPLNELGLPQGVRLAGCDVVRFQFRHEALLQFFVPAGDGVVVAQVVTKRQRSSFFDAADLNDVDVMCMRPL